MRKILLLSSLLVLAACASDTTAPDPQPQLEQGGTPPNCWPGYHVEGQGAGGYACVPNG